MEGKSMDTHIVYIAVDFEGHEDGCTIKLWVPNNVDEEEWIDNWVADNLKYVQNWDC